MAVVFVELGRRWVAAARAEGDDVRATHFPARIVAGSRAGSGTVYRLSGGFLCVGGASSVPGRFLGRTGTAVPGALGTPSLEDALLALHAFRQLEGRAFQDDLVLLGATQEACAEIAVAAAELARALSEDLSVPARVGALELPAGADVLAQARQRTQPDEQCLAICGDEGIFIWPIGNGPRLELPGLYDEFERRLTVEFAGAMPPWPDFAELALTYGSRPAAGSVPREGTREAQAAVAELISLWRVASPDALARLKAAYQAIVLVGPDAGITGAVLTGLGLPVVLHRSPAVATVTYAAKAYQNGPFSGVTYAKFHWPAPPTVECAKRRYRSHPVVRIDEVRGEVLIRLPLSELEPDVRELLALFARTTKPSPTASKLLLKIVNFTKRFDSRQ